MNIPILTNPAQTTPLGIRLKLILGLILGGCLLFGMGCEQVAEPKSKAGQIMQRAAEFLWTQQGEDGGWHSQTHGILRPGQVCTAFVLDALLEVPDSIYVVDEVQKEAGLQFLRDHLNEEGALGLADPDILEYPNYATSFALKVFVEHGKPEDEDLIARMSHYLLAEQFTEARNIDRKHAAYGGWGFGEILLPAGQVGHVDLSHTRKVLEALYMAGKLKGEVGEKAKVFVRRLQSHPQADSFVAGLAELQAKVYDGGYVYSPLQADLNKGGPRDADPEPAYSYATATADGFLSEKALGLSGEDAAAWLLNTHRWDYPEGIPWNTVQQWSLVMQYYHLMVRAECYAHIQPEFDWYGEMVDFLAPKQGPYGSFYNPDGAPNKENDPLLATSMVIRALLAGL